MREFLAFPVKPKLDSNRVKAVDPGMVIHAADAEQALQEAKKHIRLKNGETLAVAALKNLTPSDVPDRHHPITRREQELVA